MQQNNTPSLLLSAIKSQTSSTPPHLIYVIDILSIRFGGYFTPQITAELQKYPNLQMLTLNDCGIVSLQNFPYLPNLIRLDLVFNSIGGGDLKYLRNLRHIQTLMLGANKIQQISQLRQLQVSMTNLMQLDLINNPVYRKPGYREAMFEMFPRLIVLDTLDRGGKDAYDNVSMMETVGRVPQHLFMRGGEVDPNERVGYGFGRDGHGHEHRQQRAHLQRALSRLGSLDSQQVLIRFPQHNYNNNRKKQKNNKKTVHNPHSGATTTSTRTIKTTRINQRSTTTTTSTNSNQKLIFPIHKIKRMLKQSNPNPMKITKSSAIYLSSVLEYLTAQFLQQAGQQTKNQRKLRITPLILKDCLGNDQELGKLLKSAMFGTMGP